MKTVSKSFYKRVTTIITVLVLGLVVGIPTQQDVRLLAIDRFLLPQTAQASDLTDDLVITSTLSVDWLPEASVAPPVVDEAGVLKTPDQVRQTASLFFDDDDFFYSSDVGLRSASLGAPSFPPAFNQLELSLGANGFAYCPRDSFGRTYCRARDGSRSSSGGNTPPPTPEQLQIIQQMFRPQTVDEISLSAFGHTPTNEAERHVLENILKPFGGPTTGRTPIPQATSPQFGNQFNAGVGANNSVVRPLNQATLQANSLPTTMLGPQFRNQLDSYFNWPGMATQPLAGPTLTQPSSTTGACYIPAGPLTYATFVNQSSRYVLITWVDASCQEIQYAVIPPGQIYYQQSYLNYTWRVRDAQTFQYVGQVTPTAVNPRPIFTIFDVNRAGAREVGGTSESFVTENNTLAELGELINQFQNLGDQQVALFYNSNQLAALRAERTRLTYYFMYTDPVYIYVEQELEEVYRQIYTSRPSYAYSVNLAAEIDSWTSPPASSSIAKERFIKRQVLTLWQDQVESEVAAYLEANPSLSTQITQVELWLLQRYNAIMTNEVTQATAQEWLQRYTAAYNNSLNPLRAEMSQFMANHPEFKEYIQVRDEIATLLPEFENHPVVSGLAVKIAAIENDPSLTQNINQAYAQYLNQISLALDQSAFDEESEYFYAQLNYLVKSDSTYQQIRNAQLSAMQSVQGYLKTVHYAVANCFAWYGSNCNPYTDSNVQAVVDHNRLWQLLAPLANANDVYSQYWHAFYQRTDYQNLQAVAQSRIQSAQAPVLPLFEQARQQFEQYVKTIPQIQQIETEVAQTVMLFRGQEQTQDEALSRHYPSSELDQKLAQLAHLERALLGKYNHLLYLPVVTEQQ